MANIDPDLQRRLTATVLDFGAACNRIHTCAEIAAMEISKIGIIINANLRAEIDKSTVSAIDNAKRIPRKGD